MKKRLTIFAIFFILTVTFVSGCRTLTPRDETSVFTTTPTHTSSTVIKNGSLQVGTRTSMARPGW